MKKTLIKSIFALVVVITTSCVDDLTSLNKNPKAYQTVPGDTFFANGTRNLTDAVVLGMTFKILAQQFAETTYFDASSYNLVNVGGGFWNSIYRDVLRDLKESATIIENEATVYEQVKTNKLAIIEIMQVYSYSLLVNTYGDIPYSGALDASLKSEALDYDNLTPAYDDAAAIYNDLFNRLDAAIAKLSDDVGAAAPTNAFGDADLINGDDIAQWKRFANSLKLKMALTLADVNPALAKSKAEAAAAGGLISSNDENSFIRYAAVTPNTNPIWVSLIQSGREDYVASNTLLDLMKSLGTDPRIPLYYTEDKDGNYTAGIFGRSNAFVNYSHAGDAMTQETTPGVLLDYSEVEFYLAEAVSRGFNVGGTVETHYNNAITGSITYWGGTTAQATAYLANAAVAYTTAAGTPIQKIARQKYIAGFNRGLEAWTEYRRLDYPVLNTPPIPQGDFPIRYTYPNAEQTSNGASYSAAAAAIGGDVVTNRVFWDVK